MVNDEVWTQASTARPLKSWHALPGQQILCIGCLEARLGRTLMSCDFIDETPAIELAQKLLRDQAKARFDHVDALEACPPSPPSMNGSRPSSSSAAEMRHEVQCLHGDPPVDIEAWLKAERDLRKINGDAS
jgi:hypothetical protein